MRMARVNKGRQRGGEEREEKGNKSQEGEGEIKVFNDHGNKAGTRKDQKKGLSPVLLLS